MTERTDILRAGEYFLAVQGLAMIRSCVSHPSAARQRVDEIRSILASVEELMPGFIRNVVWEECATPLTQERFTRSTGGTSYGFEHTPDQFLSKRLAFQTEVPGLYLCGQNTIVGHGIVPAVASGVSAAQAALAAGEV